jgi:hypothetical protein
VPTTAVTRTQRARSFLDRTLFPEAPPPPTLTLRRALVCGGLAVAAVALQLARSWSAGPLDSLWAEDGSIWIPDAMHHGFFDALTTPYNGYLQTVSRLVATPVSWLPAGSFSAAMAISAALIVTGCAFLVWRASAGHIESPALRAVLAASLVLLPVAGTESIGNVTNTIWYLLFASFWVLLWRPATMARATAAATFLFISALSSIGSAFLLPLLLARGLTARGRRDWIMVAAFSIGLVIQIALSWDQRNFLDEGAARFEAPPAFWDWGLIPAYGQRALAGAITGLRFTGHLWMFLGATFYLFVGLALLAWLASVLLQGSNRVRLFVPLALATSLALFLVPGYERWMISGHVFLWPKDTYNSFGARYMIVPTLLVLSAVCVWLSDMARRGGPVWRRLSVALPVVILISALASFKVGNTSFQSSVSWSDALDRARTRCAEGGRTEVNVPVAPAGWHFHMPLACSNLE